MLLTRKAHMGTGTSVKIATSWRQLLLEEVAARNYWQSYLLHGFASHRDPLLDRLLPSLLYIKAVTILDDALEAVIAPRGLVMPKKYRDSLQGGSIFSPMQVS
jgi:hypothetical protein